jgi:hypothetical protein
MKYNLASADEKRKLRNIIKEMFINADLDGDGCLNKEEIEIACKNQISLKALINHSVTQVKDVDQIITDDLEEQFHTFIPISASLVTYKEGIHFPLMQSLLNLTKQNKER